VRALASLEGEARDAFREDVVKFLAGYRAADGRVRWGREYVITRAVRS